MIELLPRYFTLIEQQYLPMLISVVLLSVLTAFFYSGLSKDRFWDTLRFSSSFGLFGGVLGVIAGASHEPLIGALLSGLLTLVSAFLTFVLTKNFDKEQRGLVTSSITLLFLCALSGLAVGSAYKGQWSNFDRDYDQWLLNHKEVELPIIKRKRQYDLCVEKLEDDDLCKAILTS